MIEQTRFLSTVFLCSEFKLENIHSGGNFCRKNVCEDLYLREVFLRIAGKIAKVRTCKNFVPHGILPKSRRQDVHHCSFFLIISYLS